MALKIMVAKGETVAVVIDRDVYAAMHRLQAQQGIPLRDQLRKGMKEYLNWYGIHVTKAPGAKDAG